jgi:hypothetical protein
MNRDALIKTGNAETLNLIDLAYRVCEVRDGFSDGRLGHDNPCFARLVWPSIILLDPGRGGVCVCSALEGKDRRDPLQNGFINSPITREELICGSGIPFYSFLFFSPLL